MQFEKNHALNALNTFGLAAQSKLFIKAESIEKLQDILQSPEARSHQLLVLGGGSNLLLTRDFDGLTIQMGIKGIDVVSESEESIVVKVGAGENWHRFVLYALKQGWGGIENLSLIPGTVGAAPMQNIGAYGVEIREVFEKLTAVNKLTGEVKGFDNAACKFGYRESVFKNELKDQFIIAEVFLRLTKKDHRLNTTYGAIDTTLNDMGIERPTIQTISDAVIQIRQQKLPDPAVIGNAGSFFKNPTIDKIDYEELKIEFPEIPGYQQPGDNIKVPAAWLIEQCGWKGLTRGQIGVHKHQALVLVNYGGGSGNDLKDLALEIKESVIRKFGIVLNPEVNIV